MKDFENRELAIGDQVIYIKGRRTGSSSSRNIMFKGKVVGFTPKMVKVFKQGEIDLVSSDHIYKLCTSDYESKYLERLQALQKRNEPESNHSIADEILCELLCELGYQEIVDTFKSLEKWYA